ncbi:hypothetical protein E4U42_001785 [Claviceps africana]|uniref:PB1 domain-containing protein n=1 Tax=Claviceps africana TaxID=83212 RepID=A0A8K0NK58_9HYPO|nr:hypothetical protein E4U42_001785 [Claviceps africana]
MTLKLEIETWVAALTRYDNQEFDESLDEFEKISGTSKILFNMGVIYATMGEHEKAIEYYQRAISLDRYLAIAHFQQGVSNFLMGEFDAALINFNDTLSHLRGNVVINYEQLGLSFRLYSCEVIFNRGLCYIYLQQRDVGMNDLLYATQEKREESHNVIDEAISVEAEGYTVFSIPVGVLYRPNDVKVRNLATKDYLGKARLVATSDRSNAFTGFSGPEILKAGKPEAKDDRPANSISFAATNLVKQGLQSLRRKSEPDINSNVFPPRLHSENGRLSRDSSIRDDSRPMPAKLTIQTQGSNRKNEKAPSSEHARAIRSATSSGSSQGYHRRDPSWAPPRRPARPIEEVVEAEAEAGMYNTYRGGGDIKGKQPLRTERRPSIRSGSQHRYHEEGGVREHGDGSFRGAEPEMPAYDSRRRVSRTECRAPPRRPEVHSIRVKVHYSDVRYIMVGAEIEYPDFVDKVKDKFGMKRRFKMKIKDEDMPDGDMITVGDQDDLEMAVHSSTSLAMREGHGIAKMEVRRKTSRLAA